MARYFVLSLEKPFRQSDGFFLRQDEKLCYWPGRSEPGYVIPDHLAHRLASTAIWVGVVVPNATIACIVLPFLGTKLWEAFRWPHGVVAVALILVFGIGFRAFFALKRSRMLNECEKILEKRPDPIDPYFWIQTGNGNKRDSRIRMIFPSVVTASMIVFIVDISFDAPESQLYFIGIIASLILLSFLSWLELRRRRLLRTPFRLEDHLPPGAWFEDPKTRRIVSSFNVWVAGDDASDGDEPS